jgi:hypothetical protein
MKKSKVVFILLLVLSFFNMASKAQGPLPCGNGKIDTVAENRASRFALSNRTLLTSTYIVRVFFHIFQDDNGTNPAATPTQIAAEYSSLLSTYSTSNICFEKMGEEYINSTTINNNFNADIDNTGSALSSYQVPNCINIFYMNAINGSNTACNPPCGYGGIALGGIPGTFCLVAKGNIAVRNTVSHEVGHNLGLLHTFEPYYGGETINGSNATTAGDKVADTQADPYRFSGQSCYGLSDGNCSYVGNCQDPNGATNFSPPYTNLMTYWNCGNNPQATSGQFTRGYSFLGSNPSLIGCCSTPSFVMNGVNVSSGFRLWTATSFGTSGTNTLTNTSQNLLGGHIITLSPGFIATPTGSGYTKITITDCQ